MKKSLLEQAKIVKKSPKITEEEIELYLAFMKPLIACGLGSQRATSLWSLVDD